MEAKKWQTNLQTFMALLIGLLLLWFCGMILYNDNGTYLYLVGFSSGKVLFFALLALAGIALVFYLISLANKQKTWRVASTVLSVAAVSFIVWGQFLFAAHATAPIGWDVGNLFNTAIQPDMSGEALDYVVTWQNNLLLLCIYRIMVVLANQFQWPDVWVVLNCANIIYTDLMLLLTAILCSKIFRIHAGATVAFLGTLLLACSPWILVPYSDMPGALTLVLLLSCMVLWYRAKAWRGKLLWACAIGIGIFAGYNLKANILLIVIAGCATLVNLLLQHKSKQHVLQTIVSLAVALTVFALLQTGLQIYFQSKLTEDQKEQFPRSTLGYFFLTGLSRSNRLYGAYCQEVVNYVDSFETREERSEGIALKAREMISDLGAAGLASHYWQKIVWSSTDGTFFYGGEGVFHADQLQTTFGLRGQLQNFTYTDSEVFQKWYGNFLQGVWLAVCFLAACGCFLSRSGSTSVDWIRFLLRLSVLGMLCYIMLFEARARYLIAVTPIYLILAADGATQIQAALQRYTTKKTGEKKT